MKYIILPVCLLVTGCWTTVPVTAKFPDAAENSLEKCSALATIESPTVISELTKSVTQNYVEYHKCAAKVDGWIEWYTRQRKIFESIK
jgi:hypothetical protein